MPTELELVRRLNALAAQWRASGGSVSGPARDTLVQQFRDTLDALYATGWNSALGWENELPDQFLPERYLRRRRQVLDVLEDALGHHAITFRASEPGSKEEREAIARYHETMEELFRIGHWSGEPDAESQLPRNLMPRVYRDYWERQLKT